MELWCSKGSIEAFPGTREVILKHCGLSWSCRRRPGEIEGYHGSLGCHPEVVEAHPGAVEAYPKALEAQLPIML
jgi:hypothetical protein